MAQEQSIELTSERRVSEAGPEELGGMMRQLVARDAQSDKLKGLILLRVQDSLERGEWLKWVAMYCPMSDREARRYIALARGTQTTLRGTTKSASQKRNEPTKADTVSSFRESGVTRVSEEVRDWDWYVGVMLEWIALDEVRVRAWLREWALAHPRPQVADQARPRIEGIPTSKEWQARKGKPK